MTTASVLQDDLLKCGTESPPWLTLPLVCVWVLSLLTFTLPGREGPDTLGALDPVALAKVGARGVTILATAWILLKHWHHPRRRFLMQVVMPLMVFLGWAILSVSWSPLKAISLGQAGGLTAQLMIALLIGFLATHDQDKLRVLFHLNIVLLLIATLIFGVHILSPDASGLNRELSGEGAEGFVHPTSAGATASLGIVLLVLGKLIWNARRATLLLVVGLPVHSTVLLVANSRTAIAVTVAVTASAVVLLTPRIRLAATVLVVSSLAAIYLCLDPALELFESTFGTTTHFLMRDESVQSLQSLTGRTALWAAVWTEWQKSPLHGCGYFVTAQNGLLDVWSGPANRDAHNVWLQVLSSTGLIGLLLFVWGLARVLRRVTTGLIASPGRRQWGTFLLLVGGWYAGWSLLCSSFMGPVQPESIVFFCCLGIALAGLQTPQANLPPSPTSTGSLPTAGATP